MLPAQLLEWNQTEADYPRTSTIAEIFSAQAARTPDAIAAHLAGPFAYLSPTRREQPIALPVISSASA